MTAFDQGLLVGIAAIMGLLILAFCAALGVISVGWIAVSFLGVLLMPIYLLLLIWALPEERR